MVSTVQLHKDKDKSLLRRHPWVFSGAIKSIKGDTADGSVVQVLDSAKNILGSGHYQKGSITVRMLRYDDGAIDQDFWHSRIASAKKFRFETLKLPNSHTNCYRLIHGEGDGLPGLIVDVYGSVAVIQCHSHGMLKAIDQISDAIIANFKDEILTTFNKSEQSLGGSNGAPDGLIYGVETEEAIVYENGHAFYVNWKFGQKTGFFLDQRNNRKLVGDYAKGKSVLNCFCYTGGFSIYALAEGATKVTSIDVSARAMELTDRNVSLLQNVGNHESLTDNVMEFLSVGNDEKFDIVIVDPPAFAKSVSKRHNAVQAYKRLNQLAISRVKPGGLMFTFSCSQVVGTQLFYDTITAAAMETSRQIRVIKQLSQGEDHPVNIFHPEGHYLKGLLLYVE